MSGKSFPEDGLCKKVFLRLDVFVQSDVAIFKNLSHHTQVLKTKCRDSHPPLILSPGVGPSKISFITIHGSSSIGITVGLYTVSPVPGEYNEFYPGYKHLFKFYYLISSPSG